MSQSSVIALVFAGPWIAGTSVRTFAAAALTALEKFGIEALMKAGRRELAALVFASHDRA